MEFIKKNLAIIALLAGFVILLAPSWYFLRAKMGERQEVKAKLDDKMREREALWTNKPFPSKENVAMIQQGAKGESEKISTLLKMLQKGHVSFPQKSGSEVKEQLVVAWRRMTQILDEGQVKHLEKFQFGFERYDKLPPKDADTQLIQTQLELIEEIMRLLAAAHVSELVTIRRVVFEENRPDPKAPVAAPAPPGAWEAVISSGGKFAIVEDPTHLYSLMPFELEFWCDTDAFRTFLNSLVVDKYVLVPRVMNIENEKKGSNPGFHRDDASERPRSRRSWQACKAAVDDRRSLSVALCDGHGENQGEHAPRVV